MRHIWLQLCLVGAFVVGLMCPSAVSAMKPPVVTVQTGEAAPDMERFAAEELCRYLERLFNIKVRPTTSSSGASDVIFLVGSPKTNQAVKEATARKPLPNISDQGIVFRPARYRNRPALIVSGGSPRATLWAVYDLVSFWGVRYMLHGDVLPERAGTFRIPAKEQVSEPKLVVRQWRVVNDFPIGPESWGMADYAPVLDQLAKLKFNRILITMFPWHPFLDVEVKGIRRREARLWFGFRFPITEDMLGRPLFGNAREFWNPDLPLDASYPEFAAAGERFIHALAEYARQRGMDVAISATLTDFPAEFAPLIKGAIPVRQLNRVTIVPGPETDLDDPGVLDAAEAVLRTTVNTYPEADYIMVKNPEFRQWVGQYERAWRALDRKYKIEQILPLREVLSATGRRAGYRDSERARTEVQGDIVALYFYDRILTERKALQKTPRPGVKFVFKNVPEELYPIMARVLPSNSEVLVSVDYTPSRILKRREVLRNVPARKMPAVLIYTLHDDNIGVLPQLTTGSLHELTVDIRRHGWAGFSTRYWLIGDHDPSVSYIARAAWDANVTPESVSRDLMGALCGTACAQQMFALFQEVETATLKMEWQAMSLTFPVPGMLMKQWTPKPLPPVIEHVRNNYERALAIARQARTAATPSGLKYVDYWIGRLEFGVDYLNTIAALREAATAEAAGKRDVTTEKTTLALAALERAVNAYARVAQDQSDRGAIAVLNEYAYRPLRDKLAAMARDTAFREN